VVAGCGEWVAACMFVLEVSCKCVKRVYASYRDAPELSTPSAQDIAAYAFHFPNVWSVFVYLAKMTIPDLSYTRIQNNSIEKHILIVACMYVCSAVPCLAWNKCDADGTVWDLGSGFEGFLFCHHLHQQLGDEIRLMEGNQTSFY